MMLLNQFQTIGQELFTQGLVSSQAGNLSVRLGDRMIITRRGCRLSTIKETDLIETGITKNDRSTPLASIELAVHRAIYRDTPALAVLHAHPTHAVAASLAVTEVVPSDSEGQQIIGQVPVVGWHMKVEPGALADIIASALKEHKVVMVHGHGSFAIGQLLEEAYDYTSVLETSCRINFLLKTMKPV